MKDSEFNGWVLIAVVIGCPALFFGCLFGGLFFETSGWLAVILFTVAGAMVGLVSLFAIFSSIGKQEKHDAKS